MSAPPAIELEDVSKRFGARWAVARLSYSLPAGRSLLLTGHNGSGKTTLLRMISTATFPTAGSIKIFGAETRKQRDELRHDVALLSHASFLYEDLTAAQNLTLVAEFLALEQRKELVASLLERIGLTDRADSPVRQFSAGMRKRLTIARLLMKKPKLALFDEPFGELDPAGILQMEGLLRELQAGGTTIVLATHLVEQGQALTQERLHLSQGRKESP
ncbi:MAG: heme ABC exporter ATP-binding protein CcmA [Archangium sp.]|nr:heme ABC exporter ATP-binding protein CcmA [Archangium sp.]